MFVCARSYQSIRNHNTTSSPAAIARTPRTRTITTYLTVLLTSSSDEVGEPGGDRGVTGVAAGEVVASAVGVRSARTGIVRRENASPVARKDVTSNDAAWRRFIVLMLVTLARRGQDSPCRRRLTSFDDTPTPCHLQQRRARCRRSPRSTAPPTGRSRTCLASTTALRCDIELPRDVRRAKRMGVRDAGAAIGVRSRGRLTIRHPRSLR
jgi:hypothetical protein